jgi:hypothetical protein
MQAETGDGGAPWNGRNCTFIFLLRSKGCEVTSRARPNGDAPLHGRGVKLGEQRNDAFALTLPGEEGLEVFGDYAVENAVCRIARNVIRRGVAYGKTIIQPHEAVIITLRLVLTEEDSILANHWHC